MTSNTRSSFLSLVLSVVGGVFVAGCSTYVAVRSAATVYTATPADRIDRCLVVAYAPVTANDDERERAEYVAENLAQGLPSRGIEATKGTTSVQPLDLPEWIRKRSSARPSEYAMVVMVEPPKSARFLTGQSTYRIAWYRSATGELVASYDIAVEHHSFDKTEQRRLTAERVVASMIDRDRRFIREP